MHLLCKVGITTFALLLAFMSYRYLSSSQVYDQPEINKVGADSENEVEFPPSSEIQTDYRQPEENTVHADLNIDADVPPSYQMQTDYSLYVVLDLMNGFHTRDDAVTMFTHDQGLGLNIFQDMIYAVSRELAKKTTYGNRLSPSLDIRKFGLILNLDKHWKALGRLTGLAFRLTVFPPITFSAAIFAFLAAWNEFQIVSVLARNNDAKTFPPGLFSFTEQFTVDWRGMAAMSVIMMVPAVIFVILVQRNLVSGLTFGAADFPNVQYARGGTAGHFFR
jgi:hypothetical protein